MQARKTINYLTQTGRQQVVAIVLQGIKGQAVQLANGRHILEFSGVLFTHAKQAQQDLTLNGLHQLFDHLMHRHTQQLRQTFQ